jgi:hypothetical protein
MDMLLASRVTGPYLMGMLLASRVTGPYLIGYLHVSHATVGILRANTSPFTEPIYVMREYVFSKYRRGNTIFHI